MLFKLSLKNASLGIPSWQTPYCYQERRNYWDKTLTSNLLKAQSPQWKTQLYLLEIAFLASHQWSSLFLTAILNCGYWPHILMRIFKFRGMMLAVGLIPLRKAAPSCHPERTKRILLSFFFFKQNYFTKDYIGLCNDMWMWNQETQL